MPDSTLKSVLHYRFNEEVAVPEDAEKDPILAQLAARGSCRKFKPDAVSIDMLRMLSGVALSAPTKSDLQQRDIIIVTDRALRQQINDLLEPQHWIADAPAFLVFCGNNHRQRLVHQMRGHPFVNDHFDALFNATVDAGIALASFVTAAEALGLGCCPVSTIRNQPEQMSELLALPEHVFPVAGLAVGYPVAAPKISPRLPLSATVHEDRFDDDGIKAAIETYDAYRADVHPYATQRRPDLTDPETYTWSEDKARQYSLPERTDFGAFLRQKGFQLD